MQSAKVAVKINNFVQRNFESGGDKVNYFIIKALVELGFVVDVYCNNFDKDIDLPVNNIFIIADVPAIDKNNYKFVLGENFAPDKNVLYVHENSRHFQNKYTRSKFTNVIQKILKPKRAKQIAERLIYEKENAENAEFIFVPSSIVKNDILEFFDIEDKNIFILPPPVEKITNICEKKLNDVYTFGLSARGFGNKGGWQVILSAFLMKLFRCKFKVVIIYPFSTTVKLVKLVVFLMGLSNNITFLNYCEDITKDFYSKIDCLIMASKREAFGLVAPEAMQLGIPCILSSRCGICDYIFDGENGFIYEFDNSVKNLYKKMRYVLDNKAIAQNVGNNSRNIIDELSYEKFKERLGLALDGNRLHIL